MKSRGLGDVYKRQVSICDQSVAFHNLQREWIDQRVTHTISSGTTVATLQNEGYAFLML